MPPQDQEEYVLGESGMAPSDSMSPATTASLRRLIDETSDLIDSPSFTHVLTRLLDAAFSHLIDLKISQLSYKIPPISESTARVQEIVGSDVKAKVASSLAVFCRQAHSIGSGANNEYLSAVEGVRDLEAFAAVVYSSNFDFESPEVASVSRPATAVPESKRASLAVGGDPLGAGPLQSSGAGESWVGGEANLESAWEKALAKEDGRTV
jgi:peroxin-3